MKESRDNDEGEVLPPPVNFEPERAETAVVEEEMIAPSSSSSWSWKPKMDFALPLTTPNLLFRPPFTQIRKTSTSTPPFPFSAPLLPPPGQNSVISRRRLEIKEEEDSKMRSLSDRIFAGVFSSPPGASGSPSGPFGPFAAFFGRGGGGWPSPWN